MRSEELNRGEAAHLIPIRPQTDIIKAEDSDFIIRRMISSAQSADIIDPPDAAAACDHK